MSAFHAAVLRLVRDGTDLTLRQLVLLGECHTKPRTVRSLAESMNIGKPAITRAIDRVQELELVRRINDPDDRRSVLIELTAKGRKFVGTFPP